MERWDSSFASVHPWVLLLKLFRLCNLQTGPRRLYFKGPIWGLPRWARRNPHRIKRLFSSGKKSRKKEISGFNWKSNSVVWSPKDLRASWKKMFTSEKRIRNWSSNLNRLCSRTPVKEAKVLNQVPDWMRISLPISRIRIIWAAVIWKNKCLGFQFSKTREASICLRINLMLGEEQNPRTWGFSHFLKGNQRIIAKSTKRKQNLRKKSKGSLSLTRPLSRKGVKLVADPPFWKCEKPRKIKMKVRLGDRTSVILDRTKIWTTKRETKIYLHIWTVCGFSRTRTIIMKTTKLMANVEINPEWKIWTWTQCLRNANGSQMKIPNN